MKHVTQRFGGGVTLTSKLKAGLVSCSFLVSSCIATAQSCIQVGTSFDEENVTEAIATSDGGMMFLGYSSPNANQIYLRKLNQNGGAVWGMNYTRVGQGLHNEAYDILEDNQGNYVLVGETNNGSFTNEPAPHIMRVSSTGTFDWSTKITGDWERGELKSVIQTSDDNYVGVGYIKNHFTGDYDIYVVKVDGSGNVLWDASIGGSDDDFGNSVVVTDNGDLLIAGSTTSFSGGGSSDLYITLLSGDGQQLLNTKTLGGSNSESTKALYKTSNGYVLLGQTNSFGAGTYDVYVVFLNGGGNIQSTATIGDDNLNYATSMLRVNSGYLIGGRHDGINIDSDMFITHIDNSGTVLSSKTVGLDDKTDIGGYLVKLNNNSISMVGSSADIGPPYGNKDALLAQFDQNGNTCCELDDLDYEINSPDDVEFSGGARYDREDTKGHAQVFDEFPVNQAQVICPTASSIALMSSTKELTLEKPMGIYPNPANAQLTISLETVSLNAEVKIYNAMGQLVLDEKINKQKNQLDVSMLSKGTYVVQLYNDTIETKSLVIER